LKILAKGNKKFWTEAENLLFEEAVKKHGLDKDQIHKMVPTRTVISIQSRLDSVRQGRVIINPKALKIIKRQARKVRSWTKDE